LTEYQTIRTDTPPILAVEDGELVIKLIFGEQTFVAGVGDGRWFFSQVVAKLVDPALLVTQQIKDAAALSSHPSSVTTSAISLASPND